MKFIADGKLIDPNGVAPYMGAWIEILERGHQSKWSKVAPYMGAWIEIYLRVWEKSNIKRRTLHGCVD